MWQAKNRRDRMTQDKPEGNGHEHMATRLQRFPKGGATMPTKSPAFNRPKCCWSHLLTRDDQLCSGQSGPDWICHKPSTIGTHYFVRKGKSYKRNRDTSAKISHRLVVRHRTSVCWVTGSNPALDKAFHYNASYQNRHNFWTNRRRTMRLTSLES